MLIKVDELNTERGERFFLARHKASDYPSQLFDDWYKDPPYKKLSVKKVLFYIGGMALGDYVMFNPTLASFREAFPEAAFSIVGCPSKAVQMLAQEAGLIDKLLWSRIRKHRPWAYKKYKELWNYGRAEGTIDLLVDTQRQFLPSLILSICFEYRNRIGYSSKCFFSDWKFDEPNRKNVHDTYQSLMLARRLGIRPIPTMHSIRIPEWVEERISRLLNNISSSKIIAMFPLVSCDDPCRQWPLEYWAQLIGLLREKGYELVLLGDPGRIDVLRSMGRGNVRIFWDILSEEEREYEIFFCAALLKQVACVVGLESGGSHLAAACGANTLTLAPATRLGRYAPFGERSWVIFSDRLELEEEMTEEDRVSIIKSLTPRVVCSAIEEILHER